MKLKTVVAFANLDVGVQAQLPHGLEFSGVNVKPDVAAPDAAGFEVSADADNVYVTRTPGALDSVNVLCERWKTDERSFGGDYNTPFAALSPQPFIAAQAGASPFALPRNTLVADFNDSLPEGPNIYKTMADLYAARQAIAGPCDIWAGTAPGGFEALTIPAGVYEMGLTTWNLRGADIVFADGAQFRNPLKIVSDHAFSFGFVINENTVLPAITFDPGIAYFYMESILMLQDVAALTPIVDFPSTCSPAPAFVGSGQNTWTAGYGSVPAINFGAGIFASMLIDGMFVPPDCISSSGFCGIFPRWGRPHLHRIPGPFPGPFRGPGARWDDQPNFLGFFDGIQEEFGGMLYHNKDAAADDVNSPYAAIWNDALPADTTNGPVVIDLPTVVQHAGAIIRIKDVGNAFAGNALANNITVNAAAGETIDGAALATIAANKGSLTLVSDGVSNWEIH